MVGARRSEELIMVNRRMETQRRTSKSPKTFRVKNYEEELNFREFVNQLYDSENRTEIWQQVMSEGQTEMFEKVLLLPTSEKSKALKMEALLMIQLMDKEGIEIMRNAFRKGDSWTRSQLVGIFSTMKRTELTNELVKAIHDRRISLEKRLLALNALATSVYKNEAKMIRLLNNRDPKIRAQVVQMLGKYKTKRVHKRLKKLLMEEYDLEVIKTAINVLNEVWDEDLTLEDVLGIRDGSHTTLMVKMKRIARKFGTSVYAVIAAIVSMLISLGYSISNINALLGTALRNSPAYEEDEDEEETED